MWYICVSVYVLQCVAVCVSVLQCRLVCNVVYLCYEVASTSRLLTIIGLFCKRAQLKRRYSAKETYDFKEPTNRSHPIVYMCCSVLQCVTVCCSV